MFFARQRAFTLIELIVVIAIIGVLAAAFSFQIPKIMDSARATKCRSNLRNLARAALNFGVDEGGFPYAGSFERITSRGWQESKGWVSWINGGPWPSLDGPRPGTTVSFYGTEAYYGITNGTLWAYVNRDQGTYICEAHKQGAKKALITDVVRSYVMNGYFKYSFKGNGTAVDVRPVEVNSLSAHGSAGNLLLFAELPAYQGVDHKAGIASSGDAADCVLEAFMRKGDDLDRDSTVFWNKTAKRTPPEEFIGFNHKVGKHWAANVAFADGHVAVLEEPSGVSASDLKLLTKRLCNGDELDTTLQTRMK